MLIDRSADADLLVVVGARGRGSFTSLLLGSVATYIVPTPSVRWSLSPLPRRSSDGAEMTVVYLVDDFAPGLVLLRAVLEEQPRLSVIGTAGTLAAASEGISRSRPDVAVIDDALPDGDGVELCRQLRDARTGVASILYAVSDRPGLRERALGAGASAMLLKNIDTSELVATILAVDPGPRRDAER